MKQPIPFIEESDERKLEIIKAITAGEAWYYSDLAGKWFRAGGGIGGVSFNFIYALNEAETKPPTPDIIKWEYIHERYMYVARKKDGRIFGYTHEPVQDKHSWFTCFGGCFILPDSIVTKGTCDWKDSLQRRPE